MATVDQGTGNKFQGQGVIWIHVILGNTVFIVSESQDVQQKGVENGGVEAGKLDWNQMQRKYIIIYVCVYIHMHICIYTYTHIYVLNRVMTWPWPGLYLRKFGVNEAREWDRESGLQCSKPVWRSYRNWQHHELVLSAWNEGIICYCSFIYNETLGVCLSVSMAHPDSKHRLSARDHWYSPSTIWKCVYLLLRMFFSVDLPLLSP